MGGKFFPQLVATKWSSGQKTVQKMESGNVLEGAKMRVARGAVEGKRIRINES